MRTPNYVLTNRVNLSNGPATYDDRFLEPGTFVRPISLNYVPDHIVEFWRYFNSNVDVFCYTRHGIVPIPKIYLREV